MIWARYRNTGSTHEVLVENGVHEIARGSMCVGNTRVLKGFREHSH